MARADRRSCTLRWIFAAGMFGLAGCGGSDSPAPVYNIVVNVSGVAGSGLTLSLNGSSQLPITADGDASFSALLQQGASYDVAVVTQPNGPTQSCTVTNGSGTVGAGGVSNVLINCVTTNFAVEATVSGLSGSGLMLQLNGVGLAVSSNGVTTFPAPISSGSTYAVTVVNQPVAPTQVCSVAAASGIVGAEIADVTVSCVTSTFPVSVSIDSISGTGLVVQLNGGDNLPLTMSGSATFSSPVASGALYVVTVLAQPSMPTQTCTVTNGTGTVADQAVTNVEVACSPLYDAWTLVGADGAAVYGMQGVPSTSGRPPELAGSVSWTDAGGNLWLFGGFDQRIDVPGSPAEQFNELFRYSPANQSWTWIGGSQQSDVDGVYGVQGVPAAINMPGSRANAVSWTDAAGRFWLFGGNGYGGTTTDGLATPLNDLWKFSTATGLWTWVSGPTQGTAGVYGTQGVAAATNLPGARFQAVSWTGTDGSLWLFGGQGNNPDNFNDLWKFVPNTGLWTWVSGSNSANSPGQYGAMGTPAASNVPGARYGAVSWVGLDGSLWLFGGTGPSGNYNDLWKYSPGTGLWTWVSGSNLPNAYGTYGNFGQASPINAPGARINSVSWTTPDGKLWLFGGNGNASLKDSIFGPPFGELSDLWQFDPTTKEWIWMNGPDISNQNGTGSVGSPSATSVPSSREGAVAWTDPSGLMWLFGGAFHIDSGNEDNFYNDLWMYRPIATISSSGLATTVAVGSTADPRPVRWNLTLPLKSH